MLSIDPCTNTVVPDTAMKKASKMTRRDLKTFWQPRVDKRSANDKIAQPTGFDTKRA